MDCSKVDRIQKNQRREKNLRNKTLIYFFILEQKTEKIGEIYSYKISLFFGFCNS